MSDPAARVLVAEFTARPGRADEVAGLVGQLVEQVRAEPGNRVFAAHRKTERPDVFFVYEEYVDEEAFQRHITSEHSRLFNAALGELVEGGGSTLTWLRPV